MPGVALKKPGRSVLARAKAFVARDVVVAVVRGLVGDVFVVFGRPVRMFVAVAVKDRPRGASSHTPLRLLPSLGLVAVFASR